MPDIEQCKANIIGYIDSLAPELIGLSRTIHAQPELAFNEIEASRLLSSYLKEHGFSCRLGVGNMPTAFSACYPPHSSKTPAVTFLA